MPKLKFVLKILASLILILLIIFLIFRNNLKPEYQGNLQLDSLEAEVEVYFDDYGVPHIYAQSELDARRVLGYVHAQDRLWQMELIRRLAAGRLSEIFGEKLVATDKFFSGLGIEEAAEKTIKTLDKGSTAYLHTQAYLDGINQFIEQGPKPVEFHLLGINKELFTIKDVYNVFGYMAFSFAIAHKTDPLLTQIKEKLGPEYLKELDIIINKETTLIKNQKNPIIQSGLAKAVNEIFDQLPIAPFIGSNSWVLGPKKTNNGKVIFANDPHIGFAQPSVWYQSHIITPTYEMYGYNLALTPFPLLGHNRKYAYGMTMFENDDVDFYFEEELPENPNQYKTPYGIENYQFWPKEIKVKNGQTINYQIKVSRHGPIMNSLIEHIDDKRPMAMDWVYTQLDNKILEVAYKLSHSQSLDEFSQATSMLHAPGLNIMYGDSQDNIAWFGAAKLYKFENAINPSLILRGNSFDDKKEFLEFKENPAAINPSWNYVYSANNQPDTIAGILYPGYYLPEDRAKRIVHLLESKDKFSKEDVMSMINDVTSSVTPDVVKNALDQIQKDSLQEKELQAFETLQSWDGNFELESVAPTIYYRFIYEFLVNTYKDEMAESFDLFLNSRLQKKINAIQMARDSSIWWDNINTAEHIETKKEIISSSFKNSVLFLTKQLGPQVEHWNWKKVHTLEHPHALGRGMLLKKYFNVGPFKIHGASEVINNLAFKLDSTGYYKVHAGPSTRRVIDFGDIESSMSILPTGQSGNPLSAHYKDQAQKYNKGQFVKMQLNEKEIKAGQRLLLFYPK